MNNQPTNKQFPAFGKYKSGVKRNNKLDIDEYIALVSNEQDRKMLKMYKESYTEGQDSHKNKDKKADKVENSKTFIKMLSNALENSHAEAFEKGDRNYLEGFIGTESDDNETILKDDMGKLLKWYEIVTERNEDTDKVGTNGLSKKFIYGGETRTGKNDASNKFHIEFNIHKYGDNNIAFCTNQIELSEEYDFITYVQNQKEIIEWGENTFKKYMGVLLDEMDDPGRLGIRNAYAVENNWIPVYNQLGKLGVQSLVIITHRFNAIARTVRGADKGTEADYYIYKPSVTNKSRCEIYEAYDEDRGLFKDFITFKNLSKCGLKYDTTEAGYFTLVEEETDSKQQNKDAEEELALQTKKCNDCNQKAAQFKNAPLNPIIKTGFCWEHLPKEKEQELKEDLGFN